MIIQLVTDKLVELVSEFEADNLEIRMKQAKSKCKVLLQEEHI